MYKAVHVDVQAEEVVQHADEAMQAGAHEGVLIQPIIIQPRTLPQRHLPERESHAANKSKRHRLIVPR